MNSHLAAAQAARQRTERELEQIDRYRPLFDAADNLANAIRHAGYPARVRFETDDEGVTVAIFTATPPNDLPALAQRLGSKVRLMDYYSNANGEKRIATYNVAHQGVALVVVCQAAGMTGALYEPA